MPSTTFPRHVSVELKCPSEPVSFVCFNEYGNEFVETLDLPTDLARRLRARGTEQQPAESMGAVLARACRNS